LDPTLKALADVRADLGLNAATNDLAGLRSEVLERIKLVHPDTAPATGSVIGDAAQLTKLTDALDAISAAASAPGTTLIPLKAVEDLVLAQHQTLVAALARNIGPSVEDKVGMAVARSHARVTAGFRMPRIGLGGLLAVTGYVLVFPKQFQDNPYLAGLAGSSAGRLAWLTLMIVLIYSLLITWMIEARRNATIDEMHSLDRQLEVLAQLASETGDLDSRQASFSRSELRARLARGYRRDRSLYLRGLMGGGIDRASAEEATDLALERYKDRGLVDQVPGRLDDDWCRVQGPRPGAEAPRATPSDS
jgi:hypothetical protein